ncbi:hypothetical protein ACJRO7_005802 [Eucalyptus globulus]|uniref:Thionin-like protein n=1 Tax=Eucalyptus globulus TaxID=34317 RepID=A0ABD3J408_EUCGL
MERVGVAKLAKGVMIIMVLLLVHAAVETEARRNDDECFQKCSSRCAGMGRPICRVICKMRCKSHPLMNLDDTCISGCAESTCNSIGPLGTISQS